MKIKKLRQTELGIERLCARCKEWWPFDNEFFYPTIAWCKACWNQYCHERRTR